MSALVFAAIGLVLGFVLDELVARLARDPYHRADDEARERQEAVARGGGGPMPLAREAGRIALPASLTTRAVQRRAVVVAATGGIFTLVGLRYDGDPLNATIVAAYAAALIVCTGTDLIAHRIPDVISFPAMLLAIAVGLLLPSADPLNMLAGGALVGGTFVLMYIAARGGMGMGDVKLALFVGLALGLRFGVLAMLAGVLAGGLVAGILLVTRVRGRKDFIPYGPYICLGALWIMLTQGTVFVDLSG